MQISGKYLIRTVKIVTKSISYIPKNNSSTFQSSLFLSSIWSFCFLKKFLGVDYLLSTKQLLKAMVSADASEKGGNSSDFIQGPTIPEDGKAQSIYIIHFNDVYNVDEMNGEGGAPRFKTAVKSFANKDPLILFSGDILAPSIMSSFTHGEQMIPVLNQLDVHCAVYGNHDFDFGLERLVEVKEQTKFPWLMSNVVDNETDKPLADGHVFKIFLWKGWKIGLIGLVEEEWLCTLATINMDEVTYTDFVDRGRELASQLKNEGCDYVIALTHMRTPNDIRLAENVDEIDLILGGHDHVYEINEVNGKYVLKSGTDFREFSLLTLTAESKNVNVDIEKIEISTKFLPDEELTESLEKFSSTVNEKMEEELGTFSVDLDGRFSSIRTSETNLGNFICDVLLAACNGDVTLLNSGTLRSDRIHPAGKFTMRDLTNILPMLDSLCVLEVTGKKLLAALENGVSQYPKLEGRFPQVAGIQFAFNPNSPPGERIYKDVVKIGDEYVDEEATYRLVTKAYMRHGKDGYDMLVDCPVLQDDEQCPMLSTAVQNHFHAIQSKLGKTSRRNSTHRQSLLLLSRRHSLIRSDDEHPSPLHPHVPHGTRTQPSRPPPRHSMGRSVSIDSALQSSSGTAKLRLSKQDSFVELENEACKLCPKAEGRILKVDDIGVQNLREERKILWSVPSVIEETDEPSTPKF